MATTINAYSVSLGLDAKDYIKESSLARSETSQLARAINKARTPQEEFERSTERLGKAMRAGAIETGTYNRLMADAKTKLDATTKSANGFVTSLKSMAAGYVGLAGAQRALGVVRDRMKEIDDLAKSSRAIGENINELQRFRFAVGELGGIEGQQATTMLQKLNQRVGEAALGMGEASKHFEALGLNVQELSQMSPVQQFEALAGAISEIQNPAEQAAYATKFFEEQGTRLLPVLTATRQEYEKSAGQIGRLGLEISELDVGRIEATNDAMGRLSASVSGLGQSVASIPGLADAIDMLSIIVAKQGDVGGLRSEVTTTLIGKTGELINSLSGYSAQAERATKLNEQLAKSQAVVSAAVEAEAEVVEAIDSSSSEWFTGVFETFEGQIDWWKNKVVDAIKDVSDKEKKLRSDALDNARKHFDEQRKQQMALRKGIADTAITSMEAGSAEASRFMSQQFNRQLSESRGIDAPSTTDEQLVTEAQKQYEQLVKTNTEQAKQTALLDKMLAKLNPAKQIR